MSGLASRKAESMRRSEGFSLLEVLVTLVIVTLGLLGVAAMQGRALSAETEAFQRAQATAVLRDMVDRLNANRTTATCVPATFGTGVVTGSLSCGGAAGVDGTAVSNATAAMQGWNDLLLGGATGELGGMLNARGCVVRDGTDNLYHIAVAWQGLSDTSAPTAPAGASAALTTAVACGAGQYGASGAARRLVWTSVRIATLD